MAKSTKATTTRKSTLTGSKTPKTRMRSTTTRKTSASLRAAAPTAGESEPQTAEVATAAQAAPSVEAEQGAEVLRKRDLIEAVVMRAGVKKRDAKPAVEAALAILGETLAQGQGLNLPELGKIKIQNSKTVDDVHVMNLRLRRKIAGDTDAGSESEKEGLAEPAE